MTAGTAINTRWWWIRHAPVINPGGRIYGQRDVEADCADPAPFRELARGLPAGAAWLVTQLCRTRQTAQAIRATEALRVEPELVEQSFGDWQGLAHAEVDALFPERVHRFWLAPATEKPPGGESFAEVIARVSAAIGRLSAELAGRDVVAVAHGGSIRAALALALALDPEAALGFRIDNLSLTRLDHIAVPGHPPAWRVVAVNLPPYACDRLP